MQLPASDNQLEGQHWKSGIWQWKSPGTSHKVLAGSPHLGQGQVLPGHASGQQKVIRFCHAFEESRRITELWWTYLIGAFSQEARTCLLDVCRMRREDESPNDPSTAGLRFLYRRQSWGPVPGCQEETFPRERLPGEEGPYLSRKLEREAQLGQLSLEPRCMCYLRMSQVALLECDVCFPSDQKKSLFCCSDPICSQLGLVCLGQGEMADLIHSSPGMFIGYILHKRLGRCLKILDKSENDSPWLIETHNLLKKPHSGK